MYEIPKNLNRYEDEFIPFIKWNFRQFIYFLILLALDSGIFKLLKVSSILKFSIIIPLSIVSVFLIHLRFDERLSSWLNLKHSLRDVGYYDPKMESFIPIVSIKDNTVYLKNGILLAIIEVKPINFSILGMAEKEDVLFNFRGFLRSLEFPLQMCCRSADVNLSEWLNNMKNITLKNNNNAHSIEQIESFTKWIEEEISKSNTRNRLFYIIVPYRDFSEQKTFTDSMKEMFFFLLGKEIIFSGKRKKQYEKSLKEVEGRVSDVIEKIEKTGVSAKRMNSNQLLSLYTTYFTDMFEIDTSYLSPVMWFKSGSREGFRKFALQKVYNKLNGYDETINIDEIDLMKRLKKRGNVK
jgi:hypothetical protein